MALTADDLPPDVRLALAYALARHRRSFVTLFRFDRALAATVSAASEPMLGQIRLAWWRESLERLPDASGPDPMLHALGGMVENGLDPAGLTAMVNGWETLLQPLPLSPGQLEDYAEGRGGRLFEICAIVTGCDRATAVRAGKGWALADFAFRCSDRQTARRALDLARAMLAENRKLLRQLLPLSILRRFARRDVSRGLDRGPAAETPWRIYDALFAFVRGK